MIERIWTTYCFEIKKSLHRKFTFLGPILIIIAVSSALFARQVFLTGESAYSFIAYATPIALNLLGLLLLLVYCASLVSSELGSGSVCMVLVRPILRHEYILAKLLLGMTYALILTLTTAAMTWGIAMYIGGVHGVSYGGEVIFTDTDMLKSYLYGALLVMAPQTAVAAYAIMISSLVRSTGAAVGGAVGIMFAIDIVKYPLQLTPYVFTTYIEAPWRVFLANCEGLDAAWFPETGWILAISAISTIVFMSIAIYALSRRDLRA
jgi:ABC-type transport system involved in multi-copper enzyme maturation permease subunit